MEINGSNRHTKLSYVRFNLWNFFDESNNFKHSKKGDWNILVSTSSNYLMLHLGRTYQG